MRFHSVLLRELAHARTGDKGNLVTISVIAYEAGNFSLLQTELTTARVTEHFREIIDRDVLRYEVPHLSALIFVLHRPAGQNVTRSLAIDAHGKCLGATLLGMDLVTPLGFTPRVIDALSSSR
jgi:hypothetical protein